MGDSWLALAIGFGALLVIPLVLLRHRPKLRLVLISVVSLAGFFSGVIFG